MNVPRSHEPQPHEDLQSKIAEGLASLKRGEGVDGDEFFAQLEREEIEKLSRTP